LNIVLQLEAFEGELEQLRKIKAMIKHNVLVEKLGNIYFICGQGGAVDTNNLPERIHICPAYGCDWFQVYERTEKAHGPEY
jgi:hypothetical protein